MRLSVSGVRDEGVGGNVGGGDPAEEAAVETSSDRMRQDGRGVFP